MPEPLKALSIRPADKHDIRDFSARVLASQGHTAHQALFFQLAEGAVTRNLLAGLLDRIARLAIPPPMIMDGA